MNAFSVPECILDAPIISQILAIIPHHRFDFAFLRSVKMELCTGF